MTKWASVTPFSIKSISAEEDNRPVLDVLAYFQAVDRSESMPESVVWVLACVCCVCVGCNSEE